MAEAKTRTIHPQADRLAETLRRWPECYGMGIHDANVCRAAADAIDAMREMNGVLVAACQAVIQDATCFPHLVQLCDAAVADARGRIGPAGLWSPVPPPPKSGG